MEQELSKNENLKQNEPEKIEEESNVSVAEVAKPSKPTVIVEEKPE